MAPTGAAPPYDAVIFDMDGVVTDTASIHARAWAELFDAVLADPRAGAPGSVQPFDVERDYRRYVDGRSREDGVAAFLAARGVQMPTGAPGDGPGEWTIHGLAARKNDLFRGLVAEHGVRVFGGTVDLIERLRVGGTPVGLVTASRNADELLASSGLAGRFDVIVDGETAAAEALPGKPDPAMFLEAARRLGVDPDRTAVVEDAISGVAAAAAGGFGLVVGVDRDGGRAALEAAGADVVVDDVGLLDLGAVRADPWVVAYAGFDPAHEPHREALTTLGNGYMGTRGAAPEHAADGTHYPGTYLAGVYNRLTSTVEGRTVEHESLVNAPDWLVLDLRVDNGRWWSEGGLVVAAERRELHLRTGVLTRTVSLDDGAGRRLEVRQRRCVSMADPHLAALETTVVARGWSGPVTVRSGIDAGVVNANVAEYAGLAGRHLGRATVSAPAPDVLLVEVQTTQSQVRIATAARTTVIGAPSRWLGMAEPRPGRYGRDLAVDATDGVPFVVDKTVAVATSRDHALASAALGALDRLGDARSGLVGLLGAHEAAWRRLWDRFEVRLDAERDVQLVLNLHVFHLLTAVSPHSAELDAGVTARGLHGEGYRGHVFWDELFVLPVVGSHLPAVTRSLLDYRWRRLGAARRAARAAGLAGALFPWQSGSDGREETPTELFNPRSGRWMADNSRRQRHVGLAVAYNAWRHYETTDDTAWLAERGAELLVEVARLIASMATYDPVEDRFHIEGVMGPDEYHDGYPDAPGQGLRDNAYTNVLAAWVCRRAVDALDALTGHAREELAEELSLAPEEPATWGRLSRRLAVPFHDGGIISQFDGWEDLEEFDWTGYRSAYGNIGRLDLILEAEGDRTNRYKVTKQADVLMLVYLLGPEPLLDQLRRLDYTVTAEALARSVDHYLARTAHGSTLSRVVHASVLARLDPARAWDLFRDALVADLDDTQGGTTGEGVHLGAMAGTIDIVTRAFAGMRHHGAGLAFSPCLPEALRSVEFRVHHRGQRVDVVLDHTRIRLTGAPMAGAADLSVEVGAESGVLRPGDTLEFALDAGD